MSREFPICAKVHLFKTNDKTTQEEVDERNESSNSEESANDSVWKQKKTHIDHS